LRRFAHFSSLTQRFEGGIEGLENADIAYFEAFAKN